MKFYEITIRPVSAFGTSLKGDTLFGHFCWQLAYDPRLVEGGIENALAVYDQTPFAVFSSAYPKFEKERTCYVLPRPDIPLSRFLTVREEGREERYRRHKDLKSRKWMLLTKGLRIDLSETVLLNDDDLLKEAMSVTSPETLKAVAEVEDATVISSFTQTHNAINRLTQTTGGGDFAPFLKESTYYYPETELALFVLINTEMTDVERVVSGLEAVGRFGFGRDASTGLGRFEICDVDEASLEIPAGANACYTLGPSVPGKNVFEKTYFSPFIRFGKHGDRLATAANPFKNPVVMADEGAVLVPADTSVFDRPYIGTSVTGISKAEPGSVAQGYAPYLPFKMEHEQ